LLLILERYLLAADYFEQALSADPTHAGAHNNLEFALHALSRSEEAEDHFRQDSPKPTTISTCPCAPSEKRSKPRNNSA